MAAMRRWAMAAAALLLCAMVGCSAVLRLSNRRSLPADQPRLAEMGLLLLDDEQGLYVLGVVDGSLAGSAGIEPGDCLTSARGMALTTVAQLEELLAEQRREDALPITLARQGETVTVRLTFR